MPHWFLTAPRLFWTPFRWSWGRLKRLVADRQALRSAGSEAVTPALELAQQIGPLAAGVGNADQIRARFADLQDQWYERRSRLRVYVNQHPSDEVQLLGHEFVELVDRSYGASLYLFLRMGSADVVAANDEAQARHDESLAAGERLLARIRSY